MSDTTITVYVPFRVVKRGGRKEMHLPPGAPVHRRTDNTLDLRELETGMAKLEIYGGRMDRIQMAQIGQDIGPDGPLHSAR